MMSSFTPTSDRARVVILGNDAQLAARPANAVQLSRACLAFGYAFVAPASWGDELIASRAARFIAGVSGPSLLLHCPLVSADAEGSRENEIPRILSVSPPVATARYLRAAFSPAVVHVTYVGHCPGAVCAEIDEQVFPDVLLARLARAGCSPERQPSHFDNVLPSDRRRFTSLPGGAPSPAYLAAILPEAQLRDVAPETLATVAKYCNPNERCLLDLSVASGCHCAVDLHSMQRLEPPRATATVVNLELIVDLAPAPYSSADILTGSAPVPAHAAPSVTSGDTAPSPTANDDGYWFRPEQAAPGTGEPAVQGPVVRPAFSLVPPDLTATPGGEHATPSAPPRRAALAISGSSDSLLLAPTLRPPGAPAVTRVPPMISRAKMPTTTSGLSASQPACPETSTAIPISQEDGRHPRRHVQFDGAAIELDATARLTRRLPCRAQGSLVTRRPPDATIHSASDSTSVEPQP